jgi:hypothetical protein
MQDELDKILESIFCEQSQNLPEEPFLSNTLRLVKKHRSRQIFRQNLILLLGIVCCALLSRFFITGSIVLSGYLDRIFETTGIFLNKPAGILAAVLCCALLLLVFKRRLISKLV